MHRDGSGMSIASLAMAIDPDTAGMTRPEHADCRNIRKEGCLSLGRDKDLDRMHVQATAV